LSTDPLIAGEQLTLDLIYDTLLRWDDRYRLKPDLASDCGASADGLRITCHLVDATFHDGQPFTADDVVLSYELQWAPCAPDRGAEWGDITGIEATDPRTVVFTLRRPNALLLEDVLPGVWIEPHAVLERMCRAIRERPARQHRSWPWRSVPWSRRMRSARVSSS
jgi:peptide/nickel transport system substrate-binding protein